MACSSSSAARFSCAILSVSLLSCMARSYSVSVASCAISSASRVARMASRMSASSFSRVPCSLRAMRSRSSLSVASQRASTSACSFSLFSFSRLLASSSRTCRCLSRAASVLRAAAASRVASLRACRSSSSHRLHLPGMVSLVNMHLIRTLALSELHCTPRRLASGHLSAVSRTKCLHSSATIL
jgi:hypothetical protein